MKLKQIFWFTGLWIYPFIELPVQVLANYVGEMLGKSIPQSALLALPLPAVIHQAAINIKRARRGHTDFGFRDTIGANIIDEDHSIAKIRASYPEIPTELLSRTPLPICLGTYNHRYITYPLGKDGVNIFTVGSPGSGKSVLIQNVLRANMLLESNPNFEHSSFNWTLIDIKGEHFEKLLRTKEYKADNSNIIQVIQPSNRDSFGWDVFYSVHKDNVTDTEILKTVTDIADALVCKGGDNPYFEDNGKKILTGLLFFYIKEGIDFIPAVQKIMRNSFGILLKDVVSIAETKGYDIVLNKLTSFIDRDDNESIQDVEATMKTYLDVFSYPDIVYSLDNNLHKTSPMVLSDGKTCLDIAVEESMLETYQPFFRLLTIQILKYCESNFKETDNRKTMIIIDEAARCGQIPAIENALSTLRSRHTSVWMLYQDISQFRVIYSNRTDVILNLCEIKTFLSGAGDKNTSDYISNMSGEYETESVSYTKSGLLNAPSDPKFTRTKRAIVTGRDLMSLRSKNEMIAFILGKYYRFNKLMYFEDPNLNDEAMKARGGKL